MSAKQDFIDQTYRTLVTALQGLPDTTRRDTYALSLWHHSEDDDPRYPAVFLSYNTRRYYMKQAATASNPDEAKWNFAFWPQDFISQCGGKQDRLLKAWLATTPHFYSDAADKDDARFDEVEAHGEALMHEFIEAIITVIQQLFSHNIIESAFGSTIPVLLHELEYYDQPIEWTRRANPEGVADEFMQAYRRGIL